MHSHKKITLSNGTRVILVPHADTAAATLLVLVGVGSRHETAKLSGASHFIEHMMFKGTGKRPTTLDISRDLDTVGADYNAYTTRDHTGYYIRLPADRLPLAVDMLQDMLFGSLYRPKDVESERSVILEEIRMYEDNPLMHVDDLLDETLFRGSTLGRRVSGTAETVRGIGRGDLTAYRDRHYVPSRTVVALAGKFNERDAMYMLEDAFGRPSGRSAPAPFVRFSAAKAGFRAPRVALQRKDTEQVQLAMGWPAYALGDRRMPALKIMSTILGGTMSSRLFLSVREKHGLAYSVRSSAVGYQDVGMLSVQAGLAKDRVHKALGLIVKEVRRMKDKNVTAEELHRAKENIKGRTILDLEESSHLAEWYARQEVLRGRIETPEERLAELFAVTAADVRAVAADVFRAARASMAVIGPFADDRPFAKHLRAL